MSSRRPHTDTIRAKLFPASVLRTLLISGGRPAHGGIEINLRRTSMSIFGSIMSAIFGTAKAHETAGAGAAPTPAAVPAGPTPLSEVDVEAVLTDLASHNKEKLDWKK